MGDGEPQHFALVDFTSGRTRTVLTLLLALSALLTLPLNALGLPGTWVFLAGASLWKTLDPACPVAWWALGAGFAIALVAELLEWTLSSRYTAKYGGSRRAGWGALLGGIVGAVVGVPVPVLGSLVGSFVGAFVGALVAEYSVRPDESHAGRVAWGALVGRVVAAAMKVGLGFVVAVLVVASTIVG
jgi:uncharacterized protein